MAQTNDAITFRNVKVELSSDGSTWINVSGSTSGVIVKGGERAVYEISPVFGDATKVMTGVRKPYTLTVKSVYTENMTEAYSVLDAAYLANSLVYLRWTPAGDTPGVYRYTTVGGRVVSNQLPGGDVDQAKPLMAEYEMTAEDITKEVVA